MPIDNITYYRRRLAESRHRADEASLPEVRRVHTQMAERYSAILRDAERGVVRPLLGIVPR
ncbi:MULTISPECIES: hypothetical protein [unclassified Sphingomonas]|uniref:hypothetical protein n=1 Tax=unclassified Sphingomonas TaxID=196159 RepID=UPI0006FCAE6A|nr:MULTISPECIES: hypothetical protein [unclassified Sphingomonas]KQM28139.1 hypothetical protein ASE58_07520 [Sphingomonas sp. Leaf9]KQM44481.1 hypothetical protein ASE57_07515 [Sphingomonas sp. Leaf11]